MLRKASWTYKIYKMISYIKTLVLPRTGSSLGLDELG